MHDNHLDRRALLASAMAVGAVVTLPGSAHAAASKADIAAIRKAANAGRDASVARLQDWIRHPGIAAEK